VDYTILSADELAVACFQPGNELAWTEFIRRFQPLIVRVVSRVARQWGECNPSMVDDLVQETYLKLCADELKALRTFKAERPDAVYAYLKVFAANLVHDYFKAARSKKRGGGAITQSLEEDRLNSGNDSRHMSAPPDRQILIEQIDSCLRKVASARDRRIFWLYYRVGLAASAIANLPDIELTTKGVESTLFRLTQSVRQLVVQRRTGIADLETEGIHPAESL
jgi:RNA polymerase sigma-70 factor (ECF subfamily)